MVVSVYESGVKNAPEYKGEVSDISEHHILVGTLQHGRDVMELKDKTKRYDVSIIVNNSLYKWPKVKITSAKRGSNGVNSISINGNPKVFNRRKYPRLPINNRCTIVFEGENKTLEGRMIDISANGFAFATFEKEFAGGRERTIEVSVKGFKPLDGRKLEGRIIRVSDHDGEFLIGARMLQDDMAIKEYVEKNLDK
jgi:methyl-accepting chemotaxis protein